ncbi:MAG: SDR family NAD(P)-dependent oxidoreductase [Nitrospirales bacterium]|nr:SDR family NAD(P)-dependent oxidoreductase [Nitrospirales bacterium]
MKTTRNYSTVLIFGGSGMIGKAIALEFGRKGFAVGLQYHLHRSRAEQTATLLGKTAQDVHIVQADVRHPSEIRSALQQFNAVFGSLHVLIWAVGASMSALLVKTTTDEWLRTLDINLTGAFHTVQAAAPIFERQKTGVMIFVGSLSGEQGMAGQAAYSAAKAGLTGLMQTAAREWGHLNVRVNVVFPGWHPSPLAASRFNSVLRQTPHTLHRTPSLKHVARTVFHLAEAEDVSGQVWNLDSRIR